MDSLDIFANRARRSGGPLSSRPGSLGTESECPSRWIVTRCPQPTAEVLVECRQRQGRKHFHDVETDIRRTAAFRISRCAQIPQKTPDGELRRRTSPPSPNWPAAPHRQARKWPMPQRVLPASYSTDWARWLAGRSQPASIDLAHGSHERNRVPG